MMGLTLLTERHAEQVAGAAYLTKRRIRIFDFTQFAKPLTDAIKANAEELARSAQPLTSKFCQFRQEPNYVGTYGRGSA
jgi:hypothetical protein